MESKLTEAVSIHQSETYSPQILELLENTLWGTPGSTQYRHIGTEKTIGDIKSPLFFSLERFGKLLCTVCLSGREVNIGNEKVNSNYVRYLTASPTITGKGIRYKTNSSKEPHGMIKDFVENIFSQSNALDKLNTENNKSLHFAYVESDNDQSLHLCNYFGFRSVRNLTTLLFSRFSPKNFNNVRKADPCEYDKIKESISRQYSGHNFLYMDHLFYKGNYYVSEADGKIVAGVQANPMSWSFRYLPGLSGKVILKVLPSIPYLKRLFNPIKFDFSALEGIFCEAGYEWILDNLFETVLYKQKRNTAMVWLDLQCPMLQLIRKFCKLGLMNTINSNGSGEILVRGEGLSDSDWGLLENKPMYISCFDLN